ncbi:MDR family MFS transporter [Chengkuizengella axinellae]|uniref:MFS transporter n=1 Tax=Chengkuizengella axinellae TaxID=3064388 RepID=A0ABT9J474_9BACL|nr:MFS transporter [Chengkuizengella sp. 2205SS18-9]MDP5276396.1 MFS transporter [Chengkuizengella sp. 2205SS18-9]
MSWKDYPQNIKVRLITSFFSRVVFSAVMPFMALFFAQEMNKVWAGIFLIITVFIGFFVNLIGGYISDRLPRKKVLLITSSLSALMFLFMTISLLPKDNLIWIFAIAYVGFIVTSSLGRPAMHAIILDSTTPENRKSVYTIDYWLVNLSMAIGAALGGLLYLNHQILLFSLLCITSSMLPIAYKIWLIDEQKRMLKKQHHNVFLDLIQNYKIALQDKPFVKVVVGYMFILAAEFSKNSYIGVRLAESFQPIEIGQYKIVGVHMLSILNIQNMLLVVCLTFMVNKFTNRFSSQKVLLIGLMIYAIGYITITSANSLLILILFNFIATIGELVYSPVRNAEQANMIPDDKRGSYLAFAGISFSGADLIARSTIIIGAYLIPTMMSVYIGIVIMLGILLVYTGLFVKSSVSSNKQVTEKTA